jgi:hypothetical protein
MFGETELLKLVQSEGVWALLFVILFVWTLKKSDQRETRLMSFMDTMKEEFGNLVRQYERMSEDIEEIKDEMKDKGK